MLSRVSARSYSTAAKSVKLSTRDAPGNLSKLTVVVNNAGSKVGKAGLAHLLSTFNFLNTETKSALRFTRESELLGGTFSSEVTRDAIVLKTRFLKKDLPFYVEALGNVLTRTSFRPHELSEVVLPAANSKYADTQSRNSFVALEALYASSFKRGLGNPLYYDGSNSFCVDEIKQFASEVYNTSNVSVYGSGVNENDLTNFINESAFSSLPAGNSASIPVEFRKGQETRIRASGMSLALVGVPVMPADFAKYEVLSAAAGSISLPGYDTPLSKIQGSASKLWKHQDAGLFVFGVVSSDASAVARGIKEAKKAIESVASSDMSGAVKAADLAVALESKFDAPCDVEISAASAKGAKLGDFNYIACGNIDVLPYADEL